MWTILKATRARRSPDTGRAGRAALLIGASLGILTDVASAAELQLTSAARLDEILVTAQRRSQSIQDVPITMQAFGQNELRDRGVLQADDVIKLAPNLSLNLDNGINTSITIRGIGTNNFHGNVNRAVGVYYDDVYMATPYNGVLGVFDLERVEVLRGPQSTLFGRNTTGGAIQYISNKPVPGEDINGYVDLTYGSYDRIDIEAAIGGSLSDTIAVRAAFQTVNRDGLFNNLAPGREGEKLGERERYSGRLQLVWQPSATTNVLANFHAGLNRGTEVGVKARGLRDPGNPTQACSNVATSGDFRVTNDCVAITGVNPSTGKWKDVFNVSSARSDVDVIGGFLKIEHDFGFAALTSITSYNSTEVLLADDFAGFDSFQFVPHQDSDFDHYSQELRLASTQDQALRWILGFNFFHEDLIQGTLVRRDNGGSIAPGGETIPFNILTQNDEDLSVYGQADYDVTERLTLTGGLRFTNNRKNADSLFGVATSPITLFPADTFITRDLVLERTDGAPETCPPGGALRVDPVSGRTIGGPPPCLLPLLNPKQEINRLGARAALSYAFTDDVLLYLSYSRGFKAGGFDTRALAAFSGSAEEAVGPETLNAYEAGFKSDLFDGDLRVNGAVFYYGSKDQQTFAVQNGIPAFINIPKSEIIGAEISINWAPTEDWLVHGDFGWLDTEITRAGGLGGIDEGHVLPNSPKVTINGLVAKDFQIAGTDNLRLQAEARYVNKSFDSLIFRDDFVSRKQAQFYLNLRAAYTFGRDQQYELAVFGDNLTSQKVCNDIGVNDNPLVPVTSDLTSTVTCTPSDGRALFGGSFALRF